MATITNKSQNPLTFPGGERIEPGASVEVVNWEEAQKSGLVQAWITDGLIKATGGTETPKPTPTPTPTHAPKPEDPEDPEDDGDGDEEDEDEEETKKPDPATPARGRRKA